MIQNHYITSSAASDLRHILSNQQGVKTQWTHNSYAPTGGSELTDLADFVRILETEGAPDKSPDLGWRTGLASDYSNRGAVGSVVLGAKKLGTALQRLVQFFPLIQDATMLSLETEGDWVYLNYRILDPDIWPRHQDAMYSLSIYANLIRMAVADDWDMIDIMVEAETHEVRADLSSIVGTEVNYGGPANGLRFPVRWLDCDLALTHPAKPDLIQLLNRQLVEKRRLQSATQRVSDQIFKQLNGAKVGQGHIANELGMTTRTLRRKLAAEGQSFQQLLDECRMRSAICELRARKEISLSQLALKLGYSEHSTFSRAFVRWAGMAPQDYRKLLH